jgi:hypothetical protein
LSDFNKVPVGHGLGAAAAALLDEPLVLAAVAVTILSTGYDMTQPLFAAIVTSLGGRRPGQAMGLDVFTRFTGFGFGSLVVGKLLRLDFGAALGAFAALEAAAVVASGSPDSAGASARHGQARDE